MVIGIIGAGIAGMTAGSLLAKNGHDVTIIEKNKGFGGRMATYYAGKNNKTNLDHGLSYFSSHSPEFRMFLVELMNRDLVKRWGDNFRLFDGRKLHETNPHKNEVYFAATEGMDSIGKYMSRWVDVKTDTLAGGLTHIGSNRRKKRSWMINLTAGNTFEADAVIIAIPAPQAYGILQTTIDETHALKIVRELDEIHYSPGYSLMAGYGDREIPDWEGIICHNSDIRFISNEASKKNIKQECSLVVQSSAEFARKMHGKHKSQVTDEMIKTLAEITESWTASPEWTELTYWRHKRAESFMNMPYAELDSEEAPLALIGDYFNGNTADHAYLSGYLLANEWIKKYNS